MIKSASRRKPRNDHQDDGELDPIALPPSSNAKFSFKKSRGPTVVLIWHEFLHMWQVEHATVIGTADLRTLRADAERLHGGKKLSEGPRIPLEMSLFRTEPGNNEPFEKHPEILVNSGAIGR